MSKIDCRVAAAAVNSTVGDFHGNAHKILEAVAAARAKGADLLVFPELCLCGYNPRELLNVPAFMEKELQELDRLVSKISGLVAVVGFAEMFEGRLYNSAAVIADGRIVTIARKKHLLNQGFINEPRYFNAGTGAAYFKIGSLSFKVLINEDLYYEEGPSLASALCVCGAQPFYKAAFDHTPTLLSYHSQQQQASLIYANTVGGNDESVFSGEACVYEADGTLLACTAAFEEQQTIADLTLISKDLTDAPAALPVTRPKTEAVVSKLCQRENENRRIVKALVIGLQDYVRKCAFSRVLVGLSGGVDSSLTACLAVLALGAENVKGVLMPSRFNSSTASEDALYLSKQLGIEYQTVSIEPILQTYQAVLSPELKEDSLARQNVQARIRGNILMALANAHHYLVLVTSNKSEVFAGYSTLYGDAAGALAPLKDITKGLLYELCLEVNDMLGTSVINQSVLSKAPSAELAYDQKDSDCLPPYDQLDRIVQHFLTDKSLEHNADILYQETARKWYGTFLNSEYKLRQLPLGLSITPFSLNNNRQVPVAKSWPNI